MSGGRTVQAASPIALHVYLLPFMCTGLYAKVGSIRMPVRFINCEVLTRVLGSLYQANNQGLFIPNTGRDPVVLRI